jgi:iodothyronine deiodinase-like protein
VPALNKLYRDYRDRAAFYVVYIQEAHPVDAWQMDVNVKDDVLVNTTKNQEERDNVAKVCLTKLAVELPAVVDGPDDAVEHAYTGWPDRLYVIDRDGRVAYKSAAGPFGFNVTDVEGALKRLLNPEATNAEKRSQ